MEVKEGIEKWSKEELIDLILCKADSDEGFRRLIYSKISNIGTDSLLIHKWNEVQENIISLSYEKYIDDQIEIDLIYESCYEIIRFLDENDASIDEMNMVLKMIRENMYYNEYGLDELMEDLADSLIKKIDATE